MANQISSGLVQPALNAIGAHNLTHKAVAAAEIALATKPHYDGVEVTTTGVAELISTTLGVPTTISDAVAIFNEAKRILNTRHYTYHNTGGIAGTFAHKATTALIAVADLSLGSVYDAAALAAVKAIIDEFRTDYAAHQADGVSYHSAPDTTYVLGGSPTITTWDDVAEFLNNAKAQYTGHIADATLHDAADATNVISAANATASSIDSCITLANALRTAYNAHRTQAGVHFANDTTNVLSAAAAALSTDLTGAGALPNAIRTSYEAHRASTSYHESADGTNTITASTYGTVAQLVALAAELRTDIDAHIQFAPVSRAQRGV